MCGCDDFDQVAKFVARLGVGGDGLGDLGFHAIAKAISQPMDGYFHSFFFTAACTRRNPDKRPIELWVASGEAL